MSSNTERMRFALFSMIGIVALAQDSYLDSHKSSNHMSEAERVQAQQQEGEAFRRDGGWGRNDPNQLLNGFFPAWAILLIGLAGLFLLISLLSFVGYMFGCKKPSPESGFKKLNTSHGGI